jgi:formyltetrahydrofolate synthetase
MSIVTETTSYENYDDTLLTFQELQDKQGELEYKINKINEQMCECDDIKESKKIMNKMYKLTLEHLSLILVLSEKAKD